MNKKKVNIYNKTTRWFTNHPWLKLISLVLAVITWFYVSGEINKFN